MIGLVSVIIVGLFLGTRHANDPDHVIAVKIIVARCRKIGHAAMIGAIWGVGHALTTLMVTASRDVLGSFHIVISYYW